MTETSQTAEQANQNMIQQECGISGEMVVIDNRENTDQPFDKTVCETLNTQKEQIPGDLYKVIVESNNTVSFSFMIQSSVCNIDVAALNSTEHMTVENIKIATTTILDLTIDTS